MAQKGRVVAWRTLLLDHIDAALHVEITLGDIIVLSVENFFKAANSFRDRDILSGRSGKDLGNMEGLAPAYDLARAETVVCLRAPIHPSEDGDNNRSYNVAGPLDTRFPGVMFLDDFRASL